MNHRSHEAKLIAAVILVLCAILSAGAAPAPDAPTVRVVLRESWPYVIREGSEAKGFSVDILNEIARRNGWTLDTQLVPSETTAIASLADGTADLSIGALYLGSERERFLDYSPVIELGFLRTLVRKDRGGFHEILAATAVLFSPRMLVLYGLGLIFSVTCGLIIRKLESSNRGTFPDSRHENIWWAGQTLVAHNCSKIPSTHPGRTLALFLMLSGTLFTAQITAVLTTSFGQIVANGAPIESPADYGQRLIGTTTDTYAEKWLQNNLFRYRSFPTPIDAVRALESRKVDAAVLDESTLTRILETGEFGNLQLVGRPFGEHPHAVFLQKDSPLTNTVNRTLRELIRDGTFANLKRKWLDHGQTIPLSQ